MDVDQAQAQASAYLNEQLGPRAPSSIRMLAQFDENPLDQQGRTFVFEFDLPAAAGAPDPLCSDDPRHFVVSGQTQPNYFPAYGLDADGAYSFHVGTRFLLELGVQRVELDEPPGSRERLMQFLTSYAKAEGIQDVRLAGLFSCGEQYFAVYHVRVEGQPHYCMGCDCPPGCYQLTRYPPQVALRLHLGKLIRAEAASDDS